MAAMEQPVDALRSVLTLNRAIVLCTLAGFGLLLLEIPYEHRDVLQDERTSWIPIVFSALAIPFGLAALALWGRGGRSALSALFTLSALVGLAGVWFHAEDRQGRSVLAATASMKAMVTPTAAHAEETEADERPISESAANAGESESSPPPLAPLAFCGLGIIGLIASSRRFRAE